MGMVEKNVNPEEPVIRITINGRPAETIEMAATRCGIAVDTMRKALNRSGRQAEGSLGARIPLYLAKTVNEIIATRPGRGVGGGRPRKQQPAT